MLNAGQKKNNILTLVLSKKKFLNETKNHNPPPLTGRLVLTYGPTCLSPSCPLAELSGTRQDIYNQKSENIDN